MNTFKTFLLMLGMTFLLMAIGSMLGGNQGMIIALVIAGVMNFTSYWFSDRIVLKMYNAKEIEEGDMPELYSMVKNLAQADQMPMPKLYLVDTPMPNAFATGRNPKHAAVAVTTGIMNLLDSRELSGVIGHELSHIKDRDVLISTIAATFAGAIFILARMAQFSVMFGRGGGRDNRGGVIGMLAIAIIAPLAAAVIRLAISRSREYQADVEGARLTRDPLALAGALQKLTSGVQRNPANINPVTAPLFIVNPLTGQQFLSSLFSTHPPMPERIRRLEEMARGGISPGG